MFHFNSIPSVHRSPLGRASVTLAEFQRRRRLLAQCHPFTSSEWLDGERHHHRRGHRAGWGARRVAQKEKGKKHTFYSLRTAFQELGRLQWCGHVERRADNYGGIEVLGNRVWGTSKKTWKNCVERKDMAEMEVRREEAENRDLRWRLPKNIDPAWAGKEEVKEEEEIAVQWAAFSR